MLSLFIGRVRQIAGEKIYVYRLEQQAQALRVVISQIKNFDAQIAPWTRTLDTALDELSQAEVEEAESGKAGKVLIVNILDLLVQIKSFIEPLKKIDEAIGWIIEPLTSVKYGVKELAKAQDLTEAEFELEKSTHDTDEFIKAKGDLARSIEDMLLALGLFEKALKNYRRLFFRSSDLLGGPVSQAPRPLPSSIPATRKTPAQLTQPKTWTRGQYSLPQEETTPDESVRVRVVSRPGRKK